MTILGSLLVQPMAIEAHVVMKSSARRVEGVMQKSSAGAGQAPLLLRIVGQLPDQHRQNKGPGIVIGAVAFAEIRHAENGMLKDAGGVRHARKVRQLQL